MANTLTSPITVNGQQGNWQSNVFVPTGGFQHGEGTSSYSPTVISDQGARDKIPGMVQQASNYGVPQMGTQGQNGMNSGNTGNTGNTGSDTTSGQSYNDVYASTLKGLGIDINGSDEFSNKQLAVLDSLKSSSDAMTNAQLSSITGGYNARRQQLSESQGTETSKMANALLLSGSSRYAPISSSGIMTAKENADIQQMVQLDNEESAAKAAVYKAKQDQDFQTMGKNLDILQKTRDNKIALATTISQNVKDYNSYLLEVNKFNEQSKTNEEQRKKIENDIKTGRYEFRDMKDMFGNTVGTQVFDKTTGAPISAISSIGSESLAPGSAGLLNPVQLDEKGVPNQEQQDAYLKTLPPPIASLVKQIADYQINPTSLTYKNRTQLLAYVSTYDPTYDQTQYQARSKFNVSWNGGGMASSNNAINTALQHTTELYKAGQSLGNVAGGINPLDLKWNQLKNWISKNAGKPEVTNFNTWVNLVASEVAKAYKNGVNSNAAPTEQEIEDFKSQLFPGSSGRQINGVVETIVKGLSDKLNVNEEQYQQTMGKPPKSVLLPSTTKKLSFLKDSGLAIDTNGINYSSPEAYLNASPENVNTFKQWATKLQTLFPDRTITGEEIMQAINSNM